MFYIKIQPTWIIVNNMNSWYIFLGKNKRVERESDLNQRAK